MSTTTIPAPAASVEEEALRVGLSLGSLQHTSQRVEIDSLRMQLDRAYEDAANLLIAAAFGQAPAIVDFALRMAAEIRTKTRHQGGTNG